MMKRACLMMMESSLPGENLFKYSYLLDGN